MRVVGYIRVSTREQAEIRHGLDAQGREITTNALARGWPVVAWCEDAGPSEADLAGRAGWAEAIHQVKTAKQTQSWPLKLT